MGSHNYIATAITPGSVFSDLKGLSEKIADISYFDVEEAGPDYTDFAILDLSNPNAPEFQFYQGASGEDSDDTYNPTLRVYADEKAIAEIFAAHLVSGQMIVDIDMTGFRPRGWTITPSSVVQL